MGEETSGGKMTTVYGFRLIQEHRENRRESYTLWSMQKYLTQCWDNRQQQRQYIMKHTKEKEKDWIKKSRIYEVIQRVKGHTKKKKEYKKKYNYENEVQKENQGTEEVGGDTVDEEKMGKKSGTRKNKNKEKNKGKAIEKIEDQ